MLRSEDGQNFFEDAPQKNNPVLNALALVAGLLMAIFSTILGTWVFLKFLGF